MMFCPKCGSILTQKKEKNKTFIGCSCGYVLKSGNVEVKEEVKTKDTEIEIIDEIKKHYQKQKRMRKMRKQKSILLDDTNKSRRRTRNKILQMHKMQLHMERLLLKNF
jgi:DNA-directed RNA polymerase subunit M/transcription elongation factor TFIIS